jgi:hypothetical protein
MICDPVMSDPVEIRPDVLTWASTFLDRLKKSAERFRDAVFSQVAIAEKSHRIPEQRRTLLFKNTDQIFPRIRLRFCQEHCGGIHFVQPI